MRWLIRSATWSIPDPLQTSLRKGALVGAAVGAIFGAVAGIVWCALDPVSMGHQVVAVTVILAIFLALIAAPIGAVVLEVVRPKIGAPRPYSPSVTAQLISYCINLSALILLLFVSDAPLPATVLWFSLVAWPINRTISAIRRNRHRRFIINSHYLVCPGCEYSLTNLTTWNCPECGAGVDSDAIQRAWRKIYPEPDPRE
ncbi:MAG: hypothetical protein ACYTEI_00170 [Planctomycetota bacterium]|jgi:hypothetical protein